MRKLFIIAALLFTTSCTVRKSSEDNVNTVKPHLIVCFSRANTNSFPRIENSYGDVTVVHGNDIEYIEFTDETGYGFHIDLDEYDCVIR